MRRRLSFKMGDETDETECLDSSKTSSKVLEQLGKNNVEIASVLLSFGLVAILFGLYGIVYTIDGNLPTPLSLSDEEIYPDAFITERAQDDLKLMTDLGPRVAGGMINEVQAVNLLKREIAVIIKNANPNQKLEIDVQIVSGSHYLNRTPHGSIMAYSNLQNIVVKLHGENASQSLLVNSHFDSVPTSPGGSDDGMNCAVMLEIIRKITKHSQKPLNNIIFLFNGAEEPGLQASHGFITKHKWAKDCKVVLNLEAAGSGGKIILFQTGPAAPWLMNYYKKVPHPYGQAAGEEIFQSNLVPSDTDFRIFRDYGGLVGFDMAFFKRGYVYHTKYDGIKRIPLGSFQHVGDNALFLVRNLANAPEVANPKENPGKVVFFDFLGLVMISYSQTCAYIINSIVALLSLGIFGLSIHNYHLRSKFIWYLISTIGAIVGGWILSAVFIILLTLFIDKIGFAMSWYANPWLIFGLYGTPTVILSFVLLPFVNMKTVNYDVKAQIQAQSVRIIWTAILFIGTILNIRAVYALMIPVLFSTVAFILIYLLDIRHTQLISNKKWKENFKKLIPLRQWQIIYLICLIIPTMFLMYTKLTTLSLFIPITGRMGSDKNADLIIGIFVLFFTILITSPFVALTTCFKNLKCLLIFFSVVFGASFIIIFTPLGFPYSSNEDSPAPQRYWIIHTQRSFHHENGRIKNDSGYFLLNMDRNSPTKIEKYVSEITKTESLHEDCKNYLICGLPIVHSKMLEIIEHSTWIPAKAPLLPEPTRLEVLSKKFISSKVLRYNISIKGPDRIAVYISPRHNIKMLNISLIKKLDSKERTATWNKRDLYYIFHIYGKTASPLKFEFDVEVPENSNENTTEIAFCGIYLHDDINKKVPEYEHFLEEFPDWADVTAWVGSYESLWI